MKFFSLVFGKSALIIALAIGNFSQNLIKPTTVEYRRIPIFHFDLPIPGSYNMSGLGYDFASDDYKVVTLSFYYTDIEHENLDTFMDI